MHKKTAGMDAETDTLYNEMYVGFFHFIFFAADHGVVQYTIHKGKIDFELT